MLSCDNDLIRALILHAPKKDVRFYLQGVLFDNTAPEASYLVATDGHRMLVVRLPKQAHEDGEFILPREALELAARDKYKDFKADGDTSGTWTLNGRHLCRLVEGRYPPWRMATPKRPSGEAGQYELAYLADIGKAAKELGDKLPILQQNGAGAARYLFPSRPEVFGVLMPMDKDPQMGPHWADELVPANDLAAQAA